MEGRRGRGTCHKDGVRSEGLARKGSSQGQEVEHNSIGGASARGVKHAQSIRTERSARPTAGRPVGRSAGRPVRPASAQDRNRNVGGGRTGSATDRASPEDRIHSQGPRSVAVASRKTTFVSLLSHLSRSTKERAQPEHILITDLPYLIPQESVLLQYWDASWSRLDVSWSCPGPNDSLRPISSCDDLN